MRPKSSLVTLLLTFCFYNSIYFQVLDLEFGNQGILSIDVSESRDQACELSLTQNGEIVIAGHANLIPTLGNDIFITKYSSQGVLDETFGDVGIKLIDILNEWSEPTNQFCEDLFFEVDKSFVLANHHNEYNFDLMLVKYDVDGQIDSTFGNEGIAIFDFFDDHDYSFGIERIQNSDNLYIGYHSYMGNDEYETGIFCIDSTGNLDTSFGNAGFFTIEPTNTSVLRQLKSHGDFLYYVLADNNASTIENHSIGCVNRNGQINLGFNNGTPFEFNNILGYNYICDFEISHDGFLYFLTRVFSTGSHKLVIRKLKQNGELVESFGDSGTVIYNLVDSRGLYSAQLVPDLEEGGVLIVGGHIPISSPVDITKVFTLKLTADGQIDNLYGVGGRFDLDISESSIQIESVVLSPNRAVFILGDEINTVGGTDDDLFVIKLEGAFLTNTETRSTIYDGVKLSPNPTMGYCTISIDHENIGDFEVLILNQLGEIIQKESFRRSEKLIELNLLNLASGFYYVNVIAGEYTLMKPLVVLK